MLPPYCCLNVDAERLPIDCRLFTGIQTLLNLRTEGFKEELPPDNSDRRIIIFEVDMDPKRKRLNEVKLVPQFLVNNPNISITPTRSNQTPSALTKQSPVSTVNLVSRVSTPVSVVPLSYDHVNKQEQSSQKCIDFQEVQNSHKRISSYPISNRPEKQPRLSITKLSKSSKEKKVVTKVPEKVTKINQCKINQLKKIDSSKFNNVGVVSASSTANITNRSQELTSHQPTKHPINTEKICKLIDSTDVVIDKFSPEISKEFLVSNDKLAANAKDLLNLDVLSNSLLLNYKQELMRISKPEMVDHILRSVAYACKKFLDQEELGGLIQKNSHYLHPELFGPSETKCTVPSNNSNLQPVSHNNISTTSKRQSSSQVALKLQKTTANQPQQQLCSLKQSIQISPSSSKHTTPINVFSKTQQSIKQNDVKQLVASNQNPTSSKVISAINKLNPVNKHNQKPTSSKNSAVSITPLPSVPKQLVSNLQCSVKPSNVVCQLPLTLPDVMKCSKCKAVSEEDICTTCRMSSQLKGVTVTRIETPATQENNNNDKDNGNSKDIDNSKDKATEEIQIISSDDDDDDEKKENECISLEPVIVGVETQEVINNYISKLNLNPKFLEEILWQKELGIKDYFKFEKCTSIKIGTFTTTPAFSGDILICLHGIRMTVNNADFEPVTIDVEIGNIVKIFGYYANQPSIVIYVNNLAAVGIQHLLKMNGSNNSGYFDPTSEDEQEKRIIWSFDVKKCEQQQLEKLLLKLPKGKYEPLTTIRAEKILNKESFKKDENKRLAISQSDGSKKYSVYDNTEIHPSRLDGRQVSPVKILDYKMLAVEEYVNDILIEYYLSYWFMRQISKEDRARSFVFNTFFYTSLAKKFQHPESVRVEELSVEDRIKIRHNRVKKWTKHENIFEKDFIFVPINENFHWFMVVICYPGLTGPCLMEDGTPVTLPKPPDRPVHSPCDSINHERDECDGNTEDLWNFNINYNEQIGKDYKTDVENLKKRKSPAIKQPCILVFDSLYDGTSRARIVATLREWLVGEFRATYDGMDRDFSSKSMWGGMVKLPQQPNFTDCGLYVMHYFEQFFKFPIVDYNCPITHLENWFDDDDVVYNCKKRREVQQILIDMVEERTKKGFPLPPGITLPELNYIPNPNNTPSIPPSHPSNPNHPNHFIYLQRLAAKHGNNYQNQNYYEHNDEEDNDSNNEEECVDDEFQEDDEDAEEYSENHPYPLAYHNRYSANQNDYSDGSPDHREYFGEMVENGEWSETEGQPEEDEDFQSEHDYGADRNYYVEDEDEDEDIDDDDDDDILPDDGNDLVNDLPAGSSNHRNHANLQNVDSSDNLRAFRSSYLTISHVNDNNEDQEDESEPEVGELLNHSRKHVKH